MRIPPWLDAERALTVEIYADAVHALCVCEWVKARVEPKRGFYKLALRRRACPIHGAHGHV